MTTILAINADTPRTKALATVLLAALATSLGACADGGSARTSAARHGDAANAADATSGDGSVPIEAHVDDGGGLGLLAGTPIDDYKLRVSCPAAGFSKDFTKADLEAGRASLPSRYKGCIAFPSEIDVTTQGTRRVLAPKTAIGAQSFKSFAVGASEEYREAPEKNVISANVVLRTRFPDDLTAPSTKATVSFAIGVGEYTGLGQVAVTVPQPADGVVSSLLGTQPPQLAAITPNPIVAQAGAPAGKCALALRVRCTASPVAASGQLSQCAGVALSSLRATVTVAGAKVSDDFALDAAGVVRDAQTAALPFTVACARGGTAKTEELKNLVVNIRNDAECKTNGACGAAVIVVTSLTLTYQDP